MQIILCLSRRKKNSQNPPKLASSLALHATAVMFAYSLRNSTSFFFLPHLYQAQADCRALRSVSLLCLHSRVRANLQQEMFLAALHRIPPCLPERGALATRAMQGVLPAHGLPLGWGRGEGADSCPAPQDSALCLPTHRHTPSCKMQIWLRQRKLSAALTWPIIFGLSESANTWHKLRTLV